VGSSLGCSKYIYMSILTRVSRAVQVVCFSRGEIFQGPGVWSESQGQAKWDSRREVECFRVPALSSSSMSP